SRWNTNDVPPVFITWRNKKRCGWSVTAIESSLPRRVDSACDAPSRFRCEDAGPLGADPSAAPTVLPGGAGRCEDDLPFPLRAARVPNTDRRRAPSAPADVGQRRVLRAGVLPGQ